MQALYQGKIDNFCAAYAVLNGLKIIRNISTMQARVVLNEMFHHEAKDSEQWLKIINHETDYQNLVSRMLAKWSSTYGYKAFCPFDPQDFAVKNPTYKKSPQNNVRNPKEVFPEIDKDTIWSTLQEHTKEAGSTVVLRFCRFIPNQVGPLVDHWTTLAKITEDEMHFFDCSIEPTGWYVIPREKLYVAPFGMLPPQSVGLSQGMKLSLHKEEFAIIPPENIHVLKAIRSPFDI